HVRLSAKPAQQNSPSRAQKATNARRAQHNSPSRPQKATNARRGALPALLAEPRTPAPTPRRSPGFLVKPVGLRLPLADPQPGRQSLNSKLLQFAHNHHLAETILAKQAAYRCR